MSIDIMMQLRRFLVAVCSCFITLYLLEDIMGFYGPEPFNTAKAYYVWTGLGEPGHFTVIVQGEARNYTSGIQLVRDPHFVGGLKVDVMGWTGPLGEGSRPYIVQATFPGEFRSEIVVQGANKVEQVKVQEIPADAAESQLMEIHNATVGQPAASS
jgi:hypothetical protein